MQEAVAQAGKSDRLELISITFDPEFDTPGVLRDYAEARGIALILAGHFASERFALHSLADYLGDLLNDVVVWASRREKSPLRAV